MAQHPVILNISNVILGETSIISSYAANTVLPGQGGQLPHLDYPYYRAFYPSTNPNIMDTAPPLSMQYVTLLTDFTKDNGGTALRPHSHHAPAVHAVRHPPHRLHQRQRRDGAEAPLPPRPRCPCSTSPSSQTSPKTTEGWR